MITRTPEMSDRDWKLISVERPFAIKIDGIWRPAFGVYVYPFNSPTRVNVNYNGKTIFIVGDNNFVDLCGCSEDEMEYEVIYKNISTFPSPKRPKKKVLVAAEGYQLQGVRPNNYGIVEIVQPQPGIGYTLTDGHQ